MATDAIRQGVGVRGRTRAARHSRILQRLRAIGARGLKMAQAANRELAEDMAGGADGDGTAINGKRVRLPTYLFLILIGFAATWGQTRAEINSVAKDLAAHVAAEREWRGEHAADLDRLKALERAADEKKVAADLVVLQNNHLREENARLYGLMVGSRKPTRKLALSGRMEPHE